MTPYMLEALDTGDIVNTADCISNRFDDILHIPEVQIIKSLMRENGALNASMTGSGSAVYGIFNDDVAMLRVAEMLKEYGEVFLTKPTAAVNM